MSLWEPYLAKNLDNPYPMYARLRKEEPVYQASTGEVIITKYDHVKKVLSSNKLHTGVRLEWLKDNKDQIEKLGIDLKPIEDSMSAFLLFLNPPDHTKIRTFLMSVWSYEDAEQLVKNNVKHLLNNLDSQFDFIESFAAPLPIMTISHILGIPQEKIETLHKQTKDVFLLLNLYNTFNDLKKIQRAIETLMQEFKLLLEEKIRQPDDSLMSKIIIENSKTGRPLSDLQLCSLCFLLFNAGKETTTGLIGNGYLALLRNPENIQLLRNDTKIWNTAIDELLRYDAPAQLSVRRVYQDFKLDDHLLTKGSTIVAAIGSANNDESIFDTPEKLHLTRSNNKHLSFGGGHHYCLGDWLGKLQGVIALQSFIKHFNEVSLDGEHKFNTNITIRSLKHLPLKVQA